MLCCATCTPTLLQAYMKDYRCCVSDIENQEEKEIKVEDKWYSNWSSSVNRIKQLYS